MTDAYAVTVDPHHDSLSRLVGIVAEEAIFGLSAALGSANDALEALVERRKESHAAAMQNGRVPRMVENFDAWIIDMTRAMAPIAPPSWMPMAEVIREKVTLEIGARGLRSLFSSKPSDKDIARVKRLGTLATRCLRAVLAADGPLDGEEVRTIAAFWTLIAGVALLIFGTGPIKGVAVVHCLGIMTSMFSAVFVSRGIVALIYGSRKKLDKISIGQVWKPEAATLPKV